MNYKNLVIGLGFLTTVSGCVGINNSRKKHEVTKSPITDVINNKALNNDKFIIDKANDSQAKEILSLLLQRLKKEASKTEITKKLIEQQQTENASNTKENTLTDIVNVLIKKVDYDKLEKFINNSPIEQLLILGAILLSCGGVGYINHLGLKREENFRNICRELEQEEKQAKSKQDSKV